MTIGTPSYRKLKKGTPFVIVILAFLASFASLISQGSILLQADGGAVRGVSGDLWADLELGKRDFGEIMQSPTADHGRGGGVVVDTAISPGFAYVWDGSNSRILGYDLGECYALDSSSRCTANMVIGQPSLTDWGSCNQDSSAQYFPDKTPSSASTLCSVPEYTHTTLEDKSYTSMYLDADGNLFVYDTINNRVLEYYNPRTTDTIADQVWGQPDFTSNKCNLTTLYRQAPAAPTASSLCYMSAGAVGAGVTLDHDGNLWVADAGNNRVLRFSKDQGTGIISKVADLVLGQPNFTTGGDYSWGLTSASLHTPAAVQVGSDGNIYVLNAGDNNGSVVVRYDPPYTNFMDPTAVILSTSDIPGSGYFQMDPTGNYFWTAHFTGPNMTFKKWSLDGTFQGDTFDDWIWATGSIGFDTLGQLLVPDSDVSVFKKQLDNSYTLEINFFRVWEGGSVRPDRLNGGGWGGMVNASNGQLIVSDGRLLFWDNPMNVTNGQVPSGYVEAPNGVTSNGSLVMSIDASDKLYVQSNSNNVKVYQAPLTGSSTALQTISGPFNVLGGGTISVSFISGIAITPDSSYLWLSDADNNRTIRIKDPLTNPLVDIVLGQNDTTANLCNQGNPNGASATLTELCKPGPLKFDNKGNLYLSDVFFEIAGNFRMLMFKPSSLPTNLSSPLFDVPADKNFPTFHTTMTPAFDSTNRMVVGYNPYAADRYIEYYNDPTKINPLDHSDPDFALPDGRFNDFYGWPFDMTFDKNDNLFVYDTNRGKINIYKNPFNIDHTPPDSGNNNGGNNSGNNNNNSGNNNQPTYDAGTENTYHVPTPPKVTQPVSYIPVSDNGTSNNSGSVINSTSNTTESPAAQSVDLSGVAQLISNILADIPKSTIQVLNLVSKNIKTTDPLILSTGTAGAAGAIVISTALLSGLNLFEVLGALFGFVNARSKKYWGIVADEITGAPVAFAIITLTKKELGLNNEFKSVVVSRTVSDLNGKYRLETDQDSKLAVEVKATSYNPYYKPVSITKSLSGDVSNDIFLNPIQIHQSVFTRLFGSPKRNLFNFFKVIIFLSSMLGFGLTIREQIVNPSAFNLFLVLVYSVMVIAVVYPILYTIFLKKSYIKNKDDNQPLSGAIVRIYNDKQQIGLLMTNKKGEVRFDLEPGEYKISVNKKGYVLNNSTDANNLLTVKVNKSGYLDTNISMQRLESYINTPSATTLESPFGGTQNSVNLSA